MLGVRVLAAVVCTLACVAHAQNFTFVPPQAPMLNAGGAVAMIQAQQAFSNKYANLILNFQAAMSLGQAAQGMLLGSASEAKRDARSLEEDEDEAAAASGFFGGKDLTDAELDRLELQTEHSLMLFTKLLTVQSAKQLADSQRDHYLSKVQMMMLQGLGQHPVVSQLLRVLYYRDILQTFNSAVRIQRQDAWSLWLFLDLMETVEYDNGRTITDAFARKLSTAKTHAHNLFYTQASIDMQTLYIDHYLYSLMLRGFGVGGGSSFLEEEEEAEPGKPFAAAMLFSNPAYLGHYQHMLRFYGAYLNLVAANTLTAACTLELAGLVNPDAKSNADAVRSLNLQGALAWTQWAQVRYMELYLEYAAMFMGAAGPQQGAQPPAFGNLVQTDSSSVPVQPAEPAVAEPAAVA